MDDDKSQMKPPPDQPDEPDKATSLTDEGELGNGSSKAPLPFEPSPESVKGGSLSDLPSAIDRLGFKPYVDAMAEFLTAEATESPLTVSIEGAWGSGKTSFMYQLEEKLKDKNKLTVQFNAWRHDKEDSLWAAFALAMLDQIPGNLTFRERVWGRIKLTWYRLEWESVWRDAIPTLIRIIFAVVLPFLALLAVLFLGLWGIDLTRGKEPVESLVGLFKNPENIYRHLQTVFGAGGLYIFGKVLKRTWKAFVGNIGSPLDVDLNKYIARPDYEGHVSLIERFNKDFGHILKAYTGGERVYVFIDDIDRCQLPKASELMKALTLMLLRKSGLIFIIGMDRERVAAGMASDYEGVMPYLLYKKGDDESQEKGKIFPGHAVGHAYEFIEKFIQLHFRIPIPEGKDLSEFVERMGKPAETSEGSADADATSGFLSTKCSWLTNRFPLSKQKPPQRDGETTATPDDSDTKLTDGGKKADPNQTEEEKKKEERRETIRLELGKDSETVTKLALLLAPYFDNNPRRIIQFLNLFRLRAYIANETGLFDEVDGEDEQVPLTFERLGKFVAISLKWPLLISELYDKPNLLSDLQFYGLNEEVNRANMQAEGEKWLKEDGMVDFLREGCRAKEDSVLPPNFDRFSLEFLNVRDLLKVSPAVPRSEVLPPSSPEFEGSVERRKQSEGDAGEISALKKAKEVYETARLLEDNGDLETAEKLYRDSISIGKDMRATSTLGLAYYRLGAILRSRGEVDSAQTLSKKALEIFEDAGDDGNANRVRERLRRPGKFTIAFDYAPESPAKHGWIISPKNPLPRFSSDVDPKHGTYLHIHPNVKYSMDYPKEEILPVIMEKTEAVKFFVKAALPGTKYLKVLRQSSKPPNPPKPGWILIRESDQPPEKDKRGDDEWVIGVPPIDLERGWIEQSLNVRDVFNKTFATEGWEFAGLIGFRLRDEIEIARIELYGLPGSQEKT